MMETQRDVFSGQAVTMADVAAFLSMPAQKPVLDKTGLTGKYDLTLKADPPVASPPPSSAASGAAVASDPEGASIFTIVQEQLGLKLQSGATVPVDYIVIDHIERPTEN
jgi:uncharacterized protein (TIGR03435 family)